MDIYELIGKRHSIRSYTDTPVSDEVLKRILEAARLAPSACNLQPWRFYVVRDKAVQQAMFPHERHRWIIDKTPVVIVACSIARRAWVRAVDGKNHCDIDVAIAMEHLVLAATHEGLSTCWICAFDPAAIREALKLPPDEEPVAATPLGYGDGEARPRQRKSLEDIVTFV